MKHRFLVCTACAMLMGCAGAPAPKTTPGETQTVSENVTVAEVAETPAPVQAAPMRQERDPERIQRTSRKKQRCSISPEENSSQMVLSQDDDWFFYASENAEIDCTSIGGKVNVTDGATSVKMRILIPNGGNGKEVAAQLREQDAGFLKQELSMEYGNGNEITFEETKLGGFKRPALCADGEINMKGTPGRVVACITSSSNVNDEIIVHRVVWIDALEKYDAQATLKQVKELAANWFRYSDTNGMGKIQHKW